MQRAALYIRVSTEEQAQHGYSLEAQKHALTEYAKEHDMYIVDYYVDDGYSARRKYTSRKDFMRMLADVQSDRIDIILFIKLDRWFRSVKDYYKIQEILEAHNVGWKTTEENYDTTTTNGRLYINIRLSVAQDESDRTSDRIKFVFDNKVSRGEVISGAQPMGFRIENKHLVSDEETKDIVRDMFEYFTLHQSKYAVIRYIYEKYGIATDKSTMKKMLVNRLYIGEYRDNLSYCKPLIDRDLFEKAQRIIAEKGIRRPPSGRVYIFSGLIRCADCGHIFCGNHTLRSEREYVYYRCNFEANLKTCKNTSRFNEKDIEKWLLENIEDEVKAYVAEQTSKQSKKMNKPTIDRAKIKRKIGKLKELYLNELITLDEYRMDYESLNAQLVEDNETSAPPTYTKGLLDFIGGDFRETYGTLDRKKRKAVWRGIIREISVDRSKNMTIIFL